MSLMRYITCKAVLKTTKIRFAITLLVALVSIAYPLLVYFSLDRLQPATFSVVLVALAVLRFLTGKNQAGIAVQVAILLVFAAILLMDNNPATLRWYPVMMNAGMFAVFALSLWQTPTVIERLARLSEPNLPESGIRYTRRVTQIWCGFFILNGSIAAWTALAASWSTWTLYNGLIAYILMGSLLAGEWLLRQRIRSKAI